MRFHAPRHARLRFRGCQFANLQDGRETVVALVARPPFREAFTQARSVTYRVMAGADHGLSDEPMQHAYTNLLVGWLRHMVEEPTVTSQTAVPVA